jgi:hypothetical protein
MTADAKLLAGARLFRQNNTLRRATAETAKTESGIIGCCFARSKQNPVSAQKLNF